MIVSYSCVQNIYELKTFKITYIECDLDDLNEEKYLLQKKSRFISVLVVIYNKSINHGEVDLSSPINRGEVDLSSPINRGEVDLSSPINRGEVDLSSPLNRGEVNLLSPIRN